MGALRIITELDTLSTLSPLQVQPRAIESTFIVHYRNDIRSIQDIQSTTQSTQYESKITQRETTSRNGLYRFVTSRESPISDTQAVQTLGMKNDQLQGATGQTYRLRYLYKSWKPDIILNSGEQVVVDVHITFRTESRYSTSSTQSGNERQVAGTTQSVSIEIEMPTEYPEQVMNSIVQRVLTMHNGWDVPDLPQTISSMKKILTDVGIRGPESLQTPFDITWNDITYDRLVANPHTISFKADGTRMLLVTSPVGVFLSTSTLNIIPLSTPLTDRLRTTETRILDGELMYIDSERIQSIYWAFDTLYRGSTNYMGYPLDRRYENIAPMIDEIGDIRPPMTLPITPLPGVQQKRGIIQLRAKPIRIPTTASDFFTAVTDMTQYAIDNGITSDGLILSGVNQIYSKSVFKWKPADLMTVDFFIGPPRVGSESNVSLGTFLRGNINYHDDFIALPSERGPPLRDLIGRVSEFEYINPTTWRYVRPRDDKGRPNGEGVLNAILRLQSDPITYEALTGRSLRLMRKYHNRVKRAVYDLLKASNVDSITDVGSGKGGDMSSWQRNNLSMICIEPDMNNIDGTGGFLSRAESMGASVEVYPLEFSIQGTRTPVNEYIVTGDCWDARLFNVDANTYIDRILPEQSMTDGLTLFNSATFLDPNTLCSLVNETVHDSGMVAIMVIDGTVLQEKFLSDGPYSTPLIQMRHIPCSRETSNTSSSTSTSITMGSRARGIGVGSDQFGTLGCIFIRLGDSSTVEDGQEEGLVDVSVLLDVLRSSGWVPDVDMFLTQEKLMGQEESMYSSAQRLLILKKASTANYVIRNIYRPLLPGTTSVIEDSPWGTVTRVGVLGQGINIDNDKSFTHAILQATSPSYRSLDNISKTIMATGKDIRVVQDLIQSGTPLYAIPSSNWNMYMKPFTNGDVVDIFPAIGGAQIKRVPGVVLIENQGHWEPLAKKLIGEEYQYIW